jgi:hypothetical protein
MAEGEKTPKSLNLPIEAVSLPLQNRDQQLGFYMTLGVFSMGPTRESTGDDEMAEGEGFEPPLPVKVKRFSRPPVSTAHTSLRVRGDAAFS